MDMSPMSLSGVLLFDGFIGLSLSFVAGVSPVR